jgi:hypothetical protein
MLDEIEQDVMRAEENDNLTEARRVIAEHLPAIQAIVDDLKPDEIAILLDAIYVIVSRRSPGQPKK